MRVTELDQLPVHTTRWFWYEAACSSTVALSTPLMSVRRPDILHARARSAYLSDVDSEVPRSGSAHLGHEEETAR